MRDRLLEWLKCPHDFGSLALTHAVRDAEGCIQTGRLDCQSCGQSFPIERGVPNMVPGDAARVDGENLSRLQTATVERFGFEWQHYRDWGWLETLPDVPDAELRYFGGLQRNSRHAFETKTMFSPEESSAGNVVLDAGCGNGRFTHQAAQASRQVIGVDLGWGVYSAVENLQHLDNAHVVRADLFRLPFAEHTFDRVFSIGVLMHTGNASEAFDSIARVLAPQGLVAATVYGTGVWGYELVDAAIRRRVTGWPLERQVRFASRMSALSRWLNNRGWVGRKLHRRIYKYVNLLPTDIHMFDWWAAPIATHHTLAEVCQWFARNQIAVERSNPAVDARGGDGKRRRDHSPVTVMGRKRSLCSELPEAA